MLCQKDINDIKESVHGESLSDLLLSFIHLFAYDGFMACLAMLCKTGKYGFKAKPTTQFPPQLIHLYHSIFLRAQKTCFTSVKLQCSSRQWLQANKSL